MSFSIHKADGKVEVLDAHTGKTVRRFPIDVREGLAMGRLKVTPNTYKRRVKLVDDEADTEEPAKESAGEDEGEDKVGIGKMKAAELVQFIDEHKLDVLLDSHSKLDDKRKAVATAFAALS